MVPQRKCVMDKKKRKQLLNERRKKELEAMAASSDPKVVYRAKVELGIIPDPMTAELILTTDPEDLLELVATRAEDRLLATYHSDPQKYKSWDLHWNTLPDYIRFLHDIYYFEMMLVIGDCVKYVDNSDDEEKKRLIEGYSFFGFPGIALPMIDGDWEAIEEWYEQYRTEISSRLIHFIRDDPSKFFY